MISKVNQLHIRLTERSSTHTVPFRKTEFFEKSPTVPRNLSDHGNAFFNPNKYVKIRMGKSFRLICQFVEFWTFWHSA